MSELRLRRLEQRQKSLNTKIKEVDRKTIISGYTGNHVFDNTEIIIENGIFKDVIDWTFYGILTVGFDEDENRYLYGYKFEDFGSIDNKEEKIPFEEFVYIHNTEIGEKSLLIIFNNKIDSLDKVIINGNEFTGFNIFLNYATLIVSDNPFPSLYEDCIIKILCEIGDELSDETDIEPQEGISININNETPTISLDVASFEYDTVEDFIDGLIENNIYIQSIDGSLQTYVKESSSSINVIAEVGTYVTYNVVGI
jgi:hypothetical protein